jgi:hypothetical protein
LPEISQKDALNTSFDSYILSPCFLWA